MRFRLSARSVLLALGLAVPATALASPPADPNLQPLWTFGATQTTVLDSLPSRTGRYQLISFPLAPSPNTVSGIFGNELGAYNNEVWRFGHWDPTRSGTSKYIEMGDAATVTHGHGYWLINRDSVRVRFDGTAAPADTFELPLLQAPGGTPEWNQIGNPFAFNSAVANWRVVKRDSVLTLGQAATRTWIDANMRTWNPTTAAYSATGTIPRGSGFWARLVDPDTSLQWTRWITDQGGQLGLWSSVKLDSRGNPHIVYFLDGAGDLRYVTRKNNSWTSPALILDTTTDSFNGVWNTIEFDSLDRAHVAYGTFFGGRPFYIRQTAGGVWSPVEQIDPGPNSAYHVKMKLWHGIPRVVFVDATNSLLKYAEKTIGGWVTEPVSGLGAGNPSIQDGALGFDVDPVTGRPHIAAVTTSAPYALRYFTKVGGVWTTEVVDTLPGGETGISPSLALDAGGNPHVSYFDRTNVDLKYARKSGGSWLRETVDATGNTGQYSQILVRTNGTPVIAFLEFSSMGVPNRVRFAQRTGAGSWSIETVDDVSVSPNFAFMGATLDPQGQPRVTYQGQGGSGGQMRYAEKIRGSWRIKIPPVAAPEPAAADEVRPEAATWALGVTARQGSNAAETMYLGAANEPAIAALRSAKAPAPLDGAMLSLAVRRGEEEFVRDFQTPAETMSWTFRTEGGVTPGEQTLDFAGYDLPAGLRIFLSDHDHGWTREVRAGESVTLAARPRTLELVATTGEQVPAATVIRDGLSFAYPNPFARNTGLAFTMARRGDIRVDLYDITGRRVATMERAGASAGEHVLTWDGRDEGGRPVPSGIYMAAWRAGEAKGSRRLVKVE